LEFVGAVQVVPVSAFVEFRVQLLILGLALSWTPPSTTTPHSSRQTCCRISPA